MQNYQNTERARRYKAYVSPLGTTQLHLRNPLIIAWWSAAFPGFGHLLLSKYLRGYVLVIWEIIINVNAHINVAMIHSFNGQFELAKMVLEPRWMLLYIPTYIYAIWDSHRTSVDMNKVFILADRENARFINFQITGLEINYLDKRTPWVAVMWSIFTPGAGQLYIHRIATAFFIMVWVIIIVYFSHFLEGVHFLFLGDFNQAKSVLNGQWLLFIPSVYFFAMYDAYVNTVENNKLFDSEQRNFLKERYQDPTFDLPLNLTKRDG
ncbi:hypothetical protein MUO14_15095 [Halobacillus shinanisalinarum]|uniref:Uncharacterized protein n=1 Tax=Halobacillus shinanisalinarum TaxID=2932258 RepID=A0ABY4GUK6_9BACI|nr:hypothetical protein [Halobacillus shinanisalinarum]UOQ91841.1 hypothetical protein MUO14_15095 [Halobacillus shinanisalinarum]